MNENQIRRLRQERRLSLEQLADEVGISVSQLSRIERGLRQPTLANLRALSERLHVQVQDLAEDEPNTVPLVGYVGAGAEAHFTAAGELGEVEAPPGATDRTVAVEIRGESLGAMFDRWLVYYDDVRRPITPDLIGRLCVVGLEDGRVLIKKPMRSRARGLFHLLSQTEEPILDAAVEWAARVTAMVPR